MGTATAEMVAGGLWPHEMWFNYFASGSNHEGEILGLAWAGRNVGVAVDALDKAGKAEAALLGLKGERTLVFSRRAFEAGISKEWIKEAKEVLQAPDKWVWADFWTIDGARFEHGDALQGASYTAAYRMALYNRQTTVFGHFHTGGGVAHVNFNDLDFYGANSGCLIDAEAYAFAYAKPYKQKPSLGCTVVVDGVPYWTPMRLDRHRRWTGKM